jgi:hypothetical protein
MRGALFFSSSLFEAFFKLVMIPCKQGSGSSTVQTIHQGHGGAVIANKSQQTSAISMEFCRSLSRHVGVVALIVVLIAGMAVDTFAASTTYRSSVTPDGLGSTTTAP